MENNRKQGSKNKLDRLAKEELLIYLNKPENSLAELLRRIPSNERFQPLKHIIKMLTVGNDPVAIEIRLLLFEQFQENFKKFSHYFWHLPEDKKASELRQLIKMLPPDKISDVIHRMGGEK